MTLDQIKYELDHRDIRQTALAEYIGMTPNKLSKSLSGVRRFTVGEMDAIRAFFAEDDAANSPLRSIPVIGQVAAGNWKHAIQRPVGSMPQPDPSIPPRAFGLQVSGDSMDLLLDDGGTVIVDPEDKDLFPGRFYVVLNDEGEATFKQYKEGPARLVPCSTNPAHQDITLGSGEGFRVIGRVIWRASRM